MRWLAGCLLLTALYILAGRLGLALAFVNASATAVWPPTGIALAAVLVFGPRVWPAIFVGAFVTNQVTAGTAVTSLLIASGNTLEALMAAYLVNRFAGGAAAFDSGTNIFRYMTLAGFVSTTVSATVGVTTLSLFGLSQWAMYGPTWLTWWLGDAAGAIMITPVILLWRANSRIEWSRRELFELGIICLAVVIVGWSVFVLATYPVAFLSIPICLWAGFRFGQREAASVTCVLSLIAVWGSANGFGAFGQRAPNDSLLLVQAFLAVASITAVAVGAAVSGRRFAEGHLQAAYAELEGRVHSRTKELQDAVQRLRLSEARFADAQQVANVGSWEWDVLERSESWSDQMYRIFGVQVNSFTPSFESFSRFLHPDDRTLLDDVVRKAIVDHQPFECETRIIRVDSAVRTIHVRGRVVVGDNGTVSKFIGTAQDITDRKTAEQIVARSKRRLQTIIDAEPACVKLVSEDGLLLEMNRAGLHMLGADSVSSVVGRPVIDLVHPEDRGRFLDAHRTATAGSPVRCEFRIIGLDGNERWIDSHLVPFDAESGGTSQRAVLSCSSDITERKRLEDQLRQSQKLEAVGLLAGGIAHDFNNLLTAIGGFTDTVLETFETHDSRYENLQEVAEATRRAGALTCQLLAVSRRQILQPTVLDVNAMVAGVQRLLHRTLPENIEVQIELSPTLESVRADRGQLEQVVLNLAINAGDAMPQGGRLRLATETVAIDEVAARRRPPMPSGSYVRLTVSDTGIGMPPEIRAHVFEPFFTTKAGRGTGLGLATVYGIVKQSGGYIWVESEPGGGTTFEIYLPVVQEPVEPVMEMSPLVDYSGGSQTILLAEDDGAVRRLARDVLAKHGYTVLDARDGEEALALARKRRGAIHLLITDVVMPGLSGRDLAERLGVERPGVRVIYTSGYSEKVMMRAGFEQGLTLLPKPFLPADLLRKVGETLRASE